VEGIVRTIHSQNRDGPLIQSLLLKNGIESRAAKDVPGRKNMVKTAISVIVSTGQMVCDDGSHRFHR